MIYCGHGIELVVWPGLAGVLGPWAWAPGPGTGLVGTRVLCLGSWPIWAMAPGSGLRGLGSGFSGHWVPRAWAPEALGPKGLGASRGERKREAKFVFWACL